MQLTLNDVCNALSNLATEELRALNSEVVSTINNRQHMTARSKMRQFKVGDRVG
jgi:hypothetical protein